MLVHPQFDPVALDLGFMQIRWYGLMYVFAFAFVIILGRWQIRHRPWFGWTRQDLDDALFYGVLGTILGGRLGYVLFYKADYYLANPIEIFYIWQGGMSFHGGLLGVLLAMYVFAKKRSKRWLSVMDFVAPLVPLGLGAGRLGNFLNAELPGRVTSVPWGMLFPNAGPSPRHPSQLYELALEGIVLFLILWLFARRPRPVGAISALFLLGYGSMRFAVEFTREPDGFLGLLALNWSMGQWLSLPMIIGGVALLAYAYRAAPLAAAQK